MNRAFIAALLAFGMLFVSPAAQAQTVGGMLLESVFTPDETRLIRDFYAQRWGKGGIESPTGDVDNATAGKGKGKDKGKGDKTLPEGLAKRGGDLPPGLQKRVERGLGLPPGLAKRDLPMTLLDQLPPRSDRHERVATDDGDVVLIDKTTGVVLDILRGVFSPRH